MPLEKASAPGARERTNIVVLRLDYAQQLCDLARRLNDTMGPSAPPAGTPSKRDAPRHPEIRRFGEIAGVPPTPPNTMLEWRTDSDGTSGWSFENAFEIEARSSDRCMHTCVHVGVHVGACTCTCAAPLSLKTTSPSPSPSPSHLTSHRSPSPSPQTSPYPDPQPILTLALTLAQTQAKPRLNMLACIRYLKGVLDGRRGVRHSR